MDEIKHGNQQKKVQQQLFAWSSIFVWLCIHWKIPSNRKAKRKRHNSNLHIKIEIKWKCRVGRAAWLWSQRKNHTLYRVWYINRITAVATESSGIAMPKCVGWWWIFHTKHFSSTNNEHILNAHAPIGIWHLLPSPPPTRRIVSQPWHQHHISSASFINLARCLPLPTQNVFNWN